MRSRTTESEEVWDTSKSTDLLHHWSTNTDCCSSKQLNIILLMDGIEVFSFSGRAMDCCAGYRGFDHHTEQIFVWPTSSCYEFGCILDTGEIRSATLLSRSLSKTGLFRKPHSLPPPAMTAAKQVKLTECLTRCQCSRPVDNPPANIEHLRLLPVGYWTTQFNACRSLAC